MGILIADLQEYKKGYKKNYEAYYSLYIRNEHTRSRRLLLTYSNECGLKYLVLRKWQILSYKDIEKLVTRKDDPRNEIITTHNLEKLIKELGQAGMFRFPTRLKTTKGIPINSDNFHQYCRYEINSESKLYSEEVAFEDVQRKIADWITERIEEGLG